MYVTRNIMGGSKICGPEARPNLVHNKRLKIALPRNVKYSYIGGVEFRYASIRFHKCSILHKDHGHT